MNKQHEYNQLVEDFKKYDFKDEEIRNPYDLDVTEFNENYYVLNPWAAWQGNLNADILFIGQDFSDEEYFKENFENNWKKEIDSPTNKSLKELFSLLDINIQLPTIESNQAHKLYFTNAILGIKRNGMSAKVYPKYYEKTSHLFTKRLINIIKPKYIIVMGAVAYNMICKLYNQTIEKKLSSAIDKNGTLKLDNHTQLFVVAHCSGLGKRNRNYLQQKKDWSNIKQFII